MKQKVGEDLVAQAVAWMTSGSGTITSVLVKVGALVFMGIGMYALKRWLDKTAIKEVADQTQKQRAKDLADSASDGIDTERDATQSEAEIKGDGSVRAG